MHDYMAASEAARKASAGKAESVSADELMTTGSSVLVLQSRSGTARDDCSLYMPCAARLLLLFLPASLLFRQ